ncbi:MAG: tRNA uridine-5-carboxymethylaminomethyl(34) synthesis enzyme MnmG [Verrucomicrobiota bacterium]|nr:tRNA uridine-5-carboxymethylaminomethyl(34) synthesis enzyme MnmG [Verrucomicrobiota bacterium]
MFVYPKKYDVIVIGGGHAGIEASLASARLGATTLLLSMNLDTIGQMSCNPAIGGLSKGHIVREIDALGGAMGFATDATGVQFRMLNTKKGPAVRAPRAQCDKKAYQFFMKALCEGYPHLDIKQGHAEALRVESGKVTGVDNGMGVMYETTAVIITTGTFMRGLMHVGLKNQEGGRGGEKASGLSLALKELGFQVERFKTGTPPRVNRQSLDFSKLEPQFGDDPIPYFSFGTDPNNPPTPDSACAIQQEWAEILKVRGGLDLTKSLSMFHVEQYGNNAPWNPREQMPCWITYTNLKTAEVIRANLDKSPMYCGIIEGVGPRYCPSIEDKIVRFADKERHQIFVEPEGRHTDELYINGCSTSLPLEVQIGFIRSIPGMENAEIMRAGYAVEYDYCPPTQLKITLETKLVEGLYFAGQINGTSGYEEAAGQGLIAGANAALKIMGRDPLILDRSEAYIGVLVDDLVTKGTVEPYRMFTSRAEYRLVLRQDNADLRLYAKAKASGLVTKTHEERTETKALLIAQTKQTLEKRFEVQHSLAQILKRPESTFLNMPAEFQNLPQQVKDQVEMDLKYEGYIQRQEQEILQFKKMEEKAIPPWLKYDSILGLRQEAVQKLTKIAPATFGQATRISGITPGDLSLITVWVKRGETQFNQTKE